jgi:hypothetical protein
VEVDHKIEYFKFSQIDENDKNLSLRHFGEKYKLSAKPSEHFFSLLKEDHIEETCRWCVLLKSLNSQLQHLVKTESILTLKFGNSEPSYVRIDSNELG